MLKNPKNHRIICESIFDYKCDEKYDIVVSSGVIHHTDDKD
jgi:2-polyprenyl-3-methyl-5-hydroxy-6-metoxy-1,4-benzoquinol methylase